MNKLVATLASTTVLFAGGTFYLWQKLGERDAADAAAGATVTTAPIAAAPGASIPTTSSTTSGSVGASATVASAAKTAPGTAAASGAASAGGDVQREMMTPFAKDFLRQFDNPTQHASLLKAARAGLESQYSRLKDKLKLDANTFSQLVDLLAEEQLEQQANYFRCFLNPDCDTSKMSPPKDHSDELQALLGTDKYADFMAYRNALPEWQTVVQLRGRLSETNSLNDSNADRLMNALSAERQRYVTESGQAGAKLRGWGTGAGMVWYSADGGAEEQLASATAFTERMRQSAAAILTAEQLRAFVQMQDELLANLANYLRQQTGKP